MERRRIRPSPAARRTRARPLGLVSLAGLALAALAPMLPALANGGADDAGAAATAVEQSRGAAVYAFSCAACHGATGRGFEEAREAFPADHRACSRCHRPTNPPQMSLELMTRTQGAFSLGDPPPLDAARLERFGTAASLHAFVRTTMPRWAPGSLEDDEYLAVTRFLLQRAGLVGDHDDRPLEAILLGAGEP